MIPNVPEHMEAHLLDKAIADYVELHGIVPASIKKAYTINQFGDLLVQVQIQQKYEGPMVVFWAQPIWPGEEDGPEEAWKK